MLKNIIFLIESKYKNDIDFEKDFGIARSTVSAWRKGKLKSYRKMQNDIANFFGVSSDWLAGNEQKNKPTAERSELDKMLQNPEMKELHDILLKLSPAGIQKVKDFAHFQHEQEIKQKP